jgi:hypothetical protein
MALNARSSSVTVKTKKAPLIRRRQQINLNNTYNEGANYHLNDSANISIRQGEVRGGDADEDYDNS